VAVPLEATVRSIPIFSYYPRTAARCGRAG
jgi:hypothetical protein